MVIDAVMAAATTIERTGGRPHGHREPVRRAHRRGGRYERRPDGRHRSGGNTITLGYGEGGLLTSLADGNTHLHTFAYDTVGRRDG